MNPLALAIVFGGVIAQKPQIEEVRRAGEEFERREITLVQRAGVGPNPANAVLFQEANDLRAVPAGMAKFDGKAEAARELFQKRPQGLPVVLRGERRRQLNQDDLKLGLERFDRVEKGGQLGAGIA